MTSVKNQGGCGSCVAFAAVGALEGQLKIQANNPSWNIDLSEQHLFSCGGGTCSGGWYISSALNYLQQYGTPDEACSPYQGQSGSSSCSNSCPDWQSRAFKISSWSWVANNPSAIEAALMNGPLVAGFTVYADFYYGYNGGVYHWDHVSQAVGGHAIVIVGYDQPGQYWIIKNSWGTNWGENGYFRIGFGEADIENYAASIKASVNAKTFTLTFRTDPTSGTVTADDQTKPDGAVGSYNANQRVHILANAPSGYTFQYWEPSGVSVDNQLSQDTYMTVQNNGWLQAHFASTQPTSSSSFFHPSTEFWFSKYDMKNAEWDAIHIVNTGAQTATVQIYIAGNPMESTPITIAAGSSTYRTYPGIEGGPVHVIGDQPLWVTQRVLGWTAMQEIYGSPRDGASTELLWTWYDQAGAQADEVYVVNPSASAIAHVTFSVAGVQTGALEINAGQSGKISFPGVIGGPLKLVSDIPVFASQRVIGWNDFDEIIGLPTWYTFSEFWFNWYDMQGASWDAIHMLNPGTSTATVNIYVGGDLQATLNLGPGAADYRTFLGLVGGPVRIVSTQPIWVTQRIIGWGGWKEVFGVPVELMSTKWYFTWYDSRNAQADNIHFLNPGASPVHVTVTIAGTVFGTYTLAPGEAYHASYSGVCDGPVIIQSDGPIMVAQRIVGWSSFEETLGAQWS
jgi:hypothetical protein